MTQPTTAQMIIDQIKKIIADDASQTSPPPKSEAFCVTSCRLPKIKAALTAAAGAGPHDDCGDVGCCRDNPGYTSLTKAQLADMARNAREVEAATIDRCARLADEHELFSGRYIAERIRAMKDEKP